MARHAKRQTCKVVKLSKANGNKWYKVERYFNGKRERFYLVTKKAADADCRDRNNQIVANGTQNVLNDSRRVEAAEAYRTLSLYSRSIRDAVAFYKDHLDRLGSSITLSELVEKVRDYEHSRRISREITVEWYRTIIDRTQKFKKRFGDMPSKLLDGEEVKRWLST